MKNLCIVFPGRKYSCDRSLLYFPSKLLEQRGYEMIYLHYNIEKEEDDNRPTEEIVAEAEDYLNARLAGYDFSSYDQIIFLSKSVGTLIAARTEIKIGTKNIFNIFITPIDETLEYIKNKDLIICGDQDQFFPDSRKKLAPFSNTYIFPKFSHSLESKSDYHLTIKTINDVVSVIDVYIASLSE